MPVALLTTDRVESILRDAVAKGCYVEHDKIRRNSQSSPQWGLGVPGTAKGKGGPWICRFVNTEEVSWTGTTTG